MVSIPTIMSTTSSCQPYIIMSTTSSFQAPIILGSVRVRKRVNSPVKRCVFSGDVASGVAEVGSLFPGAGLDLQKLPAKSAQGCSESTVCTSKSRRTVTFGTLLEDEVGKMCTGLRGRSSSEPSPLPALRGRRSIWLCRSCCAGLQCLVTKTHWHGCARQSMSDAATPLANRIAAGSC